MNFVFAKLIKNHTHIDHYIMGDLLLYSEVLYGLVSPWATYGSI